VFVGFILFARLRGDGLVTPSLLNSSKEMRLPLHSPHTTFAASGVSVWRSGVLARGAPVVQLCVLGGRYRRKPERAATACGTCRAVPPSGSRS
jgi:hypothetical protein